MSNFVKKNVKVNDVDCLMMLNIVKKIKMISFVQNLTQHLNISETVE